MCIRDRREHFGDKVCKIVIPRVVRLSEAPSYGQPITVFDPDNRGAHAYRDLASEVTGHLDLDEDEDEPTETDSEPTETDSEPTETEDALTERSADQGEEE